jgi:(E)-4-hydroxy-3-methyl-but-2-enyl pyrophosphate reductase
MRTEIHMEIYIAEGSGFCFGVKSAIEKSLKTAEEDGSSYTLGELIHNSEMVERLESQNVHVVGSLEDSPSHRVVIRSHGVPPGIYEKAEKIGVAIVDATCPFVKKIHRIVKDRYDNGYSIIIAGSADHPEVIGINGYCENSALIVSNIDEAREKAGPFMESSGRVCIVAQTTISVSFWEKLVDVIMSVSDELKVNRGIEVETEFHNTVCAATKERQKNTEELSGKVDMMIVIGGKNSSNTQKLYDISRKNCKNTIYIQSSRDLVMKDLKNCGKIGVTAGASTPDWVINEVIAKLINEGGVIIYG